MICPRCAEHGITEVAHSPQAGIWTLYLCQVCQYSWRSTEPASRSERHHYPAVFQLNAVDIEQANEMPVIPTLSDTSKLNP